MFGGPWSYDSTLRGGPMPMGGDVIRQTPAAGLVDELTIIIAPVVLAGGKWLFDGLDQTVELEHLGVRESPLATVIDHRVLSPGARA